MQQPFAFAPPPTILFVPVQPPPVRFLPPIVAPSLSDLSERHSHLVPRSAMSPRWKYERCQDGVYASVAFMKPATLRLSRLYFCLAEDGCGKSFNRVFQMENHLRKHTGMRPYRCGVCDLWFKQLGNLIKH